MGIFVGLILSVFALAEIGGLSPEFDTELNPPPDVPSPTELFANMPRPQLYFLIAAGITWLIGGNLLFYLHKRRTSKKWWTFLNPFEPPFKDFNSREWLILAALLILTIFLAMLAIKN